MLRKSGGILSNIFSRKKTPTEQSWIFLRPGELCPRSYYQPVECEGNKKVAVVGLPKSGTNWLQFLLAEYLKLPIINMSEFDKGGLFSTHQTKRDLKSRTDIIKAAYIVRDIRDVIVSFWHYSQLDFYREQEDHSCHFTNLERFYFDYFLPKLVNRYRWHEHAREFAEAGVPMVRYEDLLENGEETLTLLLRRMGIEDVQENVQDALEKCMIDKFRERTVTTYVTYPKDFFRKGEKGGFKEEFSPVVLDDVQRRFEDAILRFGYALV